MADERRDERDAVGGVAAVAVEAVAAVGDHAEAPLRAHATGGEEAEGEEELAVGATHADDVGGRALRAARRGNALGQAAERDVVEHVDARLRADHRARCVDGDVGAPAHVPVRERLRARVGLRHREDRLAVRLETAIEVEVVERLAAGAEVAREIDLGLLARDEVLPVLVEARRTRRRADEQRGAEGGEEGSGGPAHWADSRVPGVPSVRNCTRSRFEAASASIIGKWPQRG